MTQPGFAKEHVERYRASNGADGHIWTGFDGTGNFPCLLLTTTGRKSGEARTTPLIYGEDGGEYMIIASQGGRPAHPGWYFNILEDASVELQVEADVFAGVARTANAEERARLWPMMADIYPPYDAYQEKAAATREIPLVILTRA
jgi:deazaflavin-dependent oxidoreductase (nitroreductase family)